MPGVKILKITVALKKKKVINGRADRNVSPLVVMGTTSFWIKGINPPFKNNQAQLIVWTFLYFTAFQNKLSPCFTMY